MKKLVIAAMVLSLTGCATQRFDMRIDTQNSPTHDNSQTFWVAGIGQSEEIDAAKVCGGSAKVQRVETQMTAGNVGLTLLTFGIYSPRQVRVYCSR
jgi:Flp pilus assembly protein TadD